MRVFLSQLVLRRCAALIAPGVLLIAGCASPLQKYLPKSLNTVFTVASSAQTVNTNGQVQLKAVLTAGGPAAVKWSIVGGENDSAIGQGTIDAHGVYTPPASLTGDAIEVEVQAQLKSDPTKTATEVIQITPAFLQPLTPENSVVAAGGTLQVTAQLAEVGGGVVEWSLSNKTNGGRRLGSAYGTMSQQSCQHNPQEYTVCSAIYNAPPGVPAAGEVYVVASVSNSALPSNAIVASNRESVHVLLNGVGVSSTPLTNQVAQTSLIELGSSGGNNNDADTTKERTGGAFINDCCGGTLGALVRDQTGTQYILSNNHVLAESDQASIGDAIVQPGLIDSNCDQNAGRPVAALRYAVPLAGSQTNVDAALAEVNAGTVDPGGAILQFGAPGSGANGGLGAAAPAAGAGEAITPALFGPDSPELMVAKSGRTTGLTCSTIDAINLSIEVDYYKDCAETQPYYHKTFANQIGIGGDGFSDSGDSGALVVNAANAEPLGLYFAGGTDGHGGGFSVASPIQDVLAALDAEAGRQFSVVGGEEHPVSCLNYDANSASATGTSDAVLRRAEGVVRKYAPVLADRLTGQSTGILDLQAGASADSPGEPAVVVYVDKEKDDLQVPKNIGGLRTVVIGTDDVSIANGSAPKSAVPAAGIHLPESVLQEAASVQQAYAKRLMADPAIFGVGVTESRDNPSEAALLVLVDMSRAPRTEPAVVGGMRVRYVLLHRFHVTRSKHEGSPRASACELKSTLATHATEDFDPEKMAPLRLP
jgi:hypothetical protein